MLHLRGGAHLAQINRHHKLQRVSSGVSISASRGSLVLAYAAYPLACSVISDYRPKYFGDILRAGWIVPCLLPPFCSPGG